MKFTMLVTNFRFLNLLISNINVIDHNPLQIVHYVNDANLS